MKRITTAKAEITLIEDSILCVEVFDGVHLEEEDVIDIHHANMKLAEEQPYALLVNSNQDTTISPEARAVSASSEMCRLRIAKAMVVTNFAQKLVGNFYIRFNKPPTPTRLFTNKEDALQWLRQFKAAAVTAH